MKDKYYDFSSSLVIGLVLTLLGTSLIIGKSNIYENIISIFIFVMWIRAIKQLITFFLKKESLYKQNINFSSCLFHLIICLILSVLPNIALGIIPFIFASYLIIIGVSQFIMFYLSIRNKTSFYIKNLFLGIIYFSIALPIFISPVTKIETFIICFSIYIILLGISYIYNAILDIIPIKTKNIIKRKIRITLPKIIEAIIPYSVMQEINKSLEVKNTYNYTKLKKEQIPDINILIHTSNRGFNRMGHIDIYFDNTLISYGNYDEGSRFIGELFGDGVIIYQVCLPFLQAHLYSIIEC